MSLTFGGSSPWRRRIVWSPRAHDRAHSAVATAAHRMQLFESLDLILLAELILLVLARKLNVPYPTLLAVAGLGFA